MEALSKKIIISCVRWYLKYPLSYRMLVKMMQEQGINVTHRGLSRISVLPISTLFLGKFLFFTFSIIENVPVNSYNNIKIRDINSPK